MGNWFRKPKTQKAPSSVSTDKTAPKSYGYSWDTGIKHTPKEIDRDTIDKSIFWVHDKNDQVIIRSPGEIDGQQFIIEQCNNCDIYVCDYSACVTIDDCTNCRIFLGPVEGSVFVRTCKNCKLILACQQFRTKDCENLDILLFCGTKPIIEESKNMRFGCFNFFYWKLNEQFNFAKLSVFNNLWSTIYDFTPKDGNYSYLPLETQPYDLLKPLSSVSNVISKQEEDSTKTSVIVPNTYGDRKPKLSEMDGVIIFLPGRSGEAKQFLQILKTTKPSIVIYKTKEWLFSSRELDHLFAKSDENVKKSRSRFEKGPIIFLSLNGKDCIQEILQVAKQTTNDTSAYYVPTNSFEISHMINFMFTVHQICS